jgi:alpha-D-ribose 1-methylphosphonate 5-phosphate C-P lyase
MIELTDQQIAALTSPEDNPPRVVNPHTQETFVLVPLAEYARLKEDPYDDSPWTREELEALAWQAAEGTDWEEGEGNERPEEP